MRKKQEALEKALRVLAGRAHSEKEIVDKLTIAGYDEREIAEAMAKLAEYNLVDDDAFAGQWAASRARRGLGPWRIAQELRQKGVDRETADTALSDIDEDAMLENAVLLAEKHLRRGDANAQRRAYDALQRRGFGYDMARRAIERAKMAIDENE